MEEMLKHNYAIQIKDNIKIDGKWGFKNDEYIYFIITSQNKEAIHMEQAALAYYLVENGFLNTAKPIQNVFGNWFTTFQNKTYMVVRVKQVQTTFSSSHGSTLANFHHINTAYNYEPQSISSYGQWKDLWINKLMIYEERIFQAAKDKQNSYYRLLMDIVPYIIGISENAIQYIQETYEDYRYDEGDQGTITFRRYDYNLLQPVLWVNDLVYDHPARDLAEFIRTKLFFNDPDSEMELATFMSDYQMYRPLSAFSWRLLYARLIFPISFYDVLAESFLYQENDQIFLNKMEDLIEKQTNYEQNLKSFFTNMGVDHEALHIPVLHWL